MLLIMVAVRMHEHDGLAAIEFRSIMGPDNSAMRDAPIVARST